MHPIFFSIGRFTVRWYGTMIATGIVVGLLLALVEGKRKGISRENIFDFLIWAIVFGFLGAKVYYILFNLKHYLANPAALASIWRGGLAIHGALLGGLGTAIVFARRRGIPFWRFADLLAPSVILGHAIGRIGCFLNGDAFGIPTKLPWGVRFPVRSYAYFDQLSKGLIGFGERPLPVHPTQLYEMGWNLIVFGVLWLVRKHLKKDGVLFLLYIILYSAGRFVIEGFRADQLKIGTLSAAQSISVLGIAASIGIMFYLMRREGAMKA
ncbi:MAG: prolipoprotein diacylglyceryl transferase [bacterium]